MKIAVGLTCLGAAAILSAAPAQAALTVSNAQSHNVTCVAGTCTATAADAILNVRDLKRLLKASDVTLVSGSMALDVVFAEKRKAGKDLLQVYHLARDELGDRQRDNLSRTVDVGHHGTCLGAGEAAKVGAQAQPNLVGVDRVNVDVDGYLRSARVVQPLQQRRTGGPQRFRAKNG